MLSRRGHDPETGCALMMLLALVGILAALAAIAYLAGQALHR